MKKLLKKIVLRILRGLAAHRMRAFKGKVIVVTGSVGKTSTKDAIYTVLNTRFRVKRTEGSMNSEFGMLLTILDIESGYSSATKWSWYLLKGFFHALVEDHSEILLLEAGIDYPGEMDFLLSVLTPDITVITSIAHVHMDEGQFQNLDQIFKEKIKPVEKLASTGAAILNFDIPLLHNYSLENPLQKTIIGFGQKPEAEYQIKKTKTSLAGTTFVLQYEDNSYQIDLAVLGEYQSQVVTPALICAHLLGIPIEQANEAISRYQLPPGRMSIISGIEETTILDSSYNSSPKALTSALETLEKLEHQGRKVAILGTMNELGAKTEAFHKKVGALIPKAAELLITVGKDAKYFAEAAVPELGEKNVHSFNSTKEAIEALKDAKGQLKILRAKDLILVKGSQSRIRLERLIKELMLYPEDAKDLLCRQNKNWTAKL